MNPFSLGQKICIFVLVVLLLAFSLAAALKTFCFTSLFPTNNIVLKQISQRVWRTDYKLNLEGKKDNCVWVIDIAGRTLNNQAWITFSTNVITKQFRKYRKAAIFFLWLFPFLACVLDDFQAFLIISGQKSSRGAHSQWETLSHQNETLQSVGTIIFGSAHRDFKPHLLCRLPTENHQISSCPICTSCGSPLGRGACRLKDFSARSPRIKGIGR